MVGFKCQLATTENHLSREPQVKGHLHQGGLRVFLGMAFINRHEKTHPKCEWHLLVAAQIRGEK